MPTAFRFSASDALELLGVPASALPQFAIVPTPVVLNLTAASSTTVLIPATPGYYFDLISATIFFVSGAGVCTLGPTLSAGNNVAADNLMATTAVPLAVVNAAIATGFPTRIAGGTPASSGTRQLLDLSTPVRGAVTVAATGVTALTGYVLLHGLLVSV